jgi:uncharacterized protein
VAAPQVAGLGAMMEPGATSDGDVLPGDSGLPAAQPQAAHWGFSATALWALMIAALYVATQLGTVLAIADWFPANPADRSFTQLINSGMDKGYSFALANLVTAIVCCPAIVVIARLKKGAVAREYLCLRPVAAKTLLRWVGLFIVFTAAIDFSFAWLDEPPGRDFMSAIYKEARPVWMLWLTLIVAAPLFEEMLFRGFLLTGLAASFMRPVGAVTVTAALWAAIHLQYSAVGIAIVFCLGLLLGAARIRTGSLIVPLTLHALQNLLATVAAAILD